MHDLPTIWHAVRYWPADQRLELATRLLQSVQAEHGAKAVSTERGEALRQLIGIWKTGQPPNDEQVELILDEARTKKYG